MALFRRRRLTSLQDLGLHAGARVQEPIHDLTQLNQPLVENWIEQIIVEKAEEATLCLFQGKDDRSFDTCWDL